MKLRPSPSAIVVVAAIVWHVLTVLSPAWVLTAEQQQARDFATYYYAVQVGRNGEDPYDRAVLNNAAKADGFRRGVHPFLYAPPFLLGMSWVSGFDLPTAYHLWFWLDELLAIATAIALYRWWRPFGSEVGAIIAVIMALMTAIPNNHAMGQANFPGLLLAILGLWQVDRGRGALGGALMGAACMLKMSPALFVVYWLVRREWTAVGWAIGAAIALSIASLPFAGPSVQLGFYTHILPQFSTGEYNGLAVPIGLFGNHSLPNVLHDITGGGSVLSPVARGLSLSASIGLLGAFGYWFRTPTTDPFVRAAQASCYGVLLLLLPVYTYEHHLVFAIPAAVITVLGLTSGRLGAGWAVPVGFAIVVLLFDLQVLKAFAEAMPPGLAALAALIRELKFGSLLMLLATAERLGHVAVPMPDPAVQSGIQEPSAQTVPG